MSRIQKAIIHARENADKKRPKKMKPTPRAPMLPIEEPSAVVHNPLVPSAAPRVGVNEEVFQANKILTHVSNDIHPAETAYRMLRTRVMRAMRGNGWQILGVSSISPNEGKTFTAINLAISIAAEVDQEAILVDLDLRRPSVYEFLGIEPDDFKDLKDYIEDDSQDLKDFLICPDIDRLGCVVSANALERPSDVLASTRGKLFFQELRERLAPEVVVIVDLPPLLSADDALVVAPMLDAFLLVVAEGYAERAELAEIRPFLHDFNHIGTVLNKSVERDTKRAGYY